MVSMQDKRFLPKISQLFDLDPVEDKYEYRCLIKEILQAWGSYNRGEYKHLSYARMHWEYGAHLKKVTMLSPDEQRLMDESMALLLEVSPALFELLKLRYIQGKTYSYIGAHHLRLTERSARRHINLSERMIYNVLASLYGSDKRQTISTVLLDDSTLEKVNYYKLQ